jgi:hypothetical protein
MFAAVFPLDLDHGQPDLRRRSIASCASGSSGAIWLRLADVGNGNRKAVRHHRQPVREAFIKLAGREGLVSIAEPPTGTE